MYNRIKDWRFSNLKFNQNSIVTLSLIISVMAIVISIPGSSNCASADSCSVASTGTFTGDLGIKSSTNYTLQQAHAFGNDVTANWIDSGGNHIGSVIMKDNAGDFNLGGGIILATSATTTTGALRYDSGNVEVYNGGWSAVGGTPSNDIGTVAGDSGSFSAVTPSDTLNVVGAGSLSTAVVGDTLTISSSAGSPAASALFKINTTYNLPASYGTDFVEFDTEIYDPDACWTASGSAPFIMTYTCADTRAFLISTWINGDYTEELRMAFRIAINATTNLVYGEYDSTTKPNQMGQFIAATGCLNQNDYINVAWGNMNEGSSIYGTSSNFGYSGLEVYERTGLSAYGVTQGCTDGVFD